MHDSTVDRLQKNALLDALSDPVIVIDPLGVLLYGNAATERIFGHRLEDRLGRSVLDLIDERDHQHAFESLVEITEAGGLGEPMELRVRTADGTTAWVEVFANNCCDDPEIGGVVVAIRDLTIRRDAEAAHRESEALFRAAFDDAPIGMSIVSLDGRFERVNESLCRLLGFTADELLAKTFQEITHPDDVVEDQRYADQMLAGARDFYAMEKRYICADGRTVWVHLSVSIIRDEHGEPKCFVSQIQDIQDRKVAEEELREASYRDPLTSLANRRALEEHLQDAFGSGTAKVGVVSCDLDDLKVINDTHGHHAGDIVLSVVAARLHSAVRDDDLVARVGGDEFIIVVPDLTEERAGALARRLTESVERPIDLTNVVVVPRISVGTALPSPDDTEPFQLLSRADRAMYKAKRQRVEMERHDPEPLVDLSDDDV